MDDNKMYLIQYSQDKSNWYDYGADRLKSRESFETLAQATRKFQTLITAYQNDFRYVRIIDKHDNIIKEAELY